MSQGGTIADECRARLDAAMAAKGLDLLLVYGNAWQCDYLRYVAGFGILEGQGLALAERGGGVTLYLDSALEVDRAAAETPDIKIVHAANLVAEVAAALARIGNRQTGAAPVAFLPHGIAHSDAGRRMSDETRLLDDLLMVKCESELATMRRAARMADAGYEIFRAAARIGRADYELVAEVEAFYRRQGVDDNFMIIGVGGPEVRGMAPPTGKRLRKGDLVTTELTPCVDGYYAQICRTLVLGPASAEQMQCFAVYRDALEAGIATVRPGIKAADIARAENDVFRRHGLGEYVTSEYTRVRGHGLGLFPDTKPHILEDVETLIEARMTLIVHPNTYHPVVGYFVLGDALIVTETGADVLTGTQRALFSVEG
jgi:Xaa-Pro dipeptidase